MATELGSAFISVGMGTNTLAGDIKKAFGGAESSGSDAGKSAGKGFGLGFAGIATAAIGALGIGTYLKGAITGAGDLQQSAGAIGSVFKENAAQMLAWSKTSATAVGLTQNEFNELGTVIGAQLKNGGTAMDELAPKTNSLITTGADLASMFGGTTSEAVEALSSALKGERDPIERYGVSLNQAKIDAEAAALGFEKVGNTFSSQAQQAATLSLITKQTADATGNFAKESETLAGQQQRMAAGFKNVQTQIGGLFLPALTQLFGFVNTSILPVLDKFTASLGDEGLGGAFAPLLAVAGPVFAGLAAQFGPLIPQVMQLVASFSPLGLLFQVLTPILPLLSTAFTQITGSIAGVLAIVIPLVSQLVSALLPVIVNLVSTILPPLAAIFGELVSAVAPFVVQIASDLIPIINALMPVVTTVFGVIASVIKSAMQIVQGVIQVVTGIISGNWSKVWQGIQNVFAGIWNTIGTIISGAMQILGSVVSSGIGNVVNFFGGLGGKILGALGNLGGLLVNAGAQILEGFLKGLQAGFESVKNFVGGIGQWIADNKGPKAYDLALLVPAGGWIMDGLESGIERSLPSLQRTLGGVSATIAAGITGANYSPAYTPATVGGGGAAGGAFPDSLILSVDGHQFTAYVAGVSRGELASASRGSTHQRGGSR